MSPPPLFEARDSRAFWLVMVLTFTVLAVVSSAVWGWGAAGIGFFGLQGVWSLLRVLDRRPRLIVTEEGVIDRTYLLLSPGLIPWSEIARFEPSRLGMIRVELRDEGAFWARLSPLQKFAAGKLHLYGLGPAAIQSWVLDSSQSDFLDELDFAADALAASARIEALPLPNDELPKAGSAAPRRSD